MRLIGFDTKKHVAHICMNREEVEDSLKYISWMGCYVERFGKPRENIETEFEGVTPERAGKVANVLKKTLSVDCEQYSMMLAVDNFTTLDNGFSWISQNQYRGPKIQEAGVSLSRARELSGMYFKILKEICEIYEKMRSICEPANGRF